MQAIVIHKFGPPDVLVPEPVLDPVPGPNQVGIAVEVAGVTFVETQVRAGRPPNPAMLPALPAILGNGVGGRVIAVGEAVDPGRVGQRVVTSLNGTGGYAELAVTDDVAPIEVPANLATTDAVALLADGRTAIGLMRGAHVQAGETVLVEAAAGGVGSLLVQLARTAGARVVGVARGARKLELARELGASVVVDYSQAGWPTLVRSAAGEVDVVFDGVGGSIGRAAFDLLHAGGRFSTFGMASGAFVQLPEGAAEARRITVLRGARATPDELRELARTALTEASAGRLWPLIGQTFPLEQAAAAHRAIEQRATVGKTLLYVSG
jgi:NADPH2:quinone reductase